MMFIGRKMYHRTMISIFYCLCAIWALTSLSGCLKNIPSEETPINGDVTLLWDEVPGAISYNVYLSLSPGVTKQSGYKIPNVTNPVRINYLAPGNTYYFVVTAVNRSGESQASKELSYFAVADKIGLVYWKQLFDQPIQDYQADMAENETSPERTSTEPDREPLGNEALIVKTAGDEKPSSSLTKGPLPSPQKRVVETADIEKNRTAESKPTTVAVATGTDQKVLTKEPQPTSAAVATGTDQKVLTEKPQPPSAAVATGTDQKVLTEKPPPPSAAVATGTDQKDLAEEPPPTSVAVATGSAEKDLTEEPPPAGAAVETGTDQEDLPEESEPTTVAVATGTNQEDLPEESEPTTVAVATGTDQEDLSEESEPATVVVATGTDQEDLSEESEPAGAAVATGTDQEDLPEESEPTTVAVATGTDQNLSGWETLRLKAAQKLAASQFYIFFDQDSNELTPEAIEKLDQIYNILTKNSVAKLKLNGYSDSSGDPSFSKMVSEVRATSVKSYLSGRGIKPSRMTAVGHGDIKSLASNKSAEGRRLNRRVEIELIIP